MSSWSPGSASVHRTAKNGNQAEMRRCVSGEQEADAQEASLHRCLPPRCTVLLSWAVDERLKTVPGGFNCDL